MSYNIGQIKYDDLTIPNEVYTPVSIKSGGEYETALLEGTYQIRRLVYKNLSLEKGAAYFMRVYIKRQRALQQTITARLTNDVGLITQKCKVLYVDALSDIAPTITNPPLIDTKYWTCCKFIFVPNQVGYTKLVFDLPDLLASRNNIIVAEVSAFNKVINLLDTKVKEKHGINSIIKLGVQSRPGTVMCINGEEIRIGRSGFYEINSGVEITYFGFGAELRDFIFDYVYDTESLVRLGEGDGDVIL